MIGLFEVILTLGIVSLPFLFVLCIIAMCRGGGGRKREQKMEVEETRLIQEIHQSLNRLEDRIEALETIVLETERSKDRVS